MANELAKKYPWFFCGLSPWQIMESSALAMLSLVHAVSTGRLSLSTVSCRMSHAAFMALPGEYPAGRCKEPSEMKCFTRPSTISTTSFLISANSFAIFSFLFVRISVLFRSQSGPCYSSISTVKTSFPLATSLITCPGISSGSGSVIASALSMKHGRDTL